jgi:uncharacterized protein (DUF924 family)
MTEAEHKPEDVLSFWFPDNRHWNSTDTHAAFWTERMHGGMDDRICSKFADLTEAAATGQLDHWAGTPRGRLALLIALDQFPRSLWRDTPKAYGQDIKATRLALEGIENGDFAQLRPWEQAFFLIAISHCEGPDHLDRMHMLESVTEEIIAGMPEAIREMGQGFRDQTARVTEIIARFGRHPHRNPILGRLSTPEEEAYIATGDFPHLRKPEEAGA